MCWNKEGKDAFWSFLLHTPNRALGGKRPPELLETNLGSQQVEEVLGRIESGVYS